MFSFNDFTPPATGFKKFWENLKKITKTEKHSVYIITNAHLNQSIRIEATLSRLALEIPEHTELILDIKKKFVIFPKPIKGKYNWKTQLELIRQKVGHINSINIDPDLLISDGAKNKMREFLDAWERLLKDNFDCLFDAFFKPMLMGASLDLDIESIKLFQSIKKVEDIPSFLTYKMFTMKQAEGDTKEQKEERDLEITTYIVLAESIRAILEYRKLLIDLANRKECGIFEAYFTSQINYYAKFAELILVDDFHIRSRELELQIRTKIIEELFNKEEEEICKLTSLQNQLNSSDNDNFINIFAEVIDINNEIQSYNKIKEKLLQMDQKYSDEFSKVQGYMKSSIETLIDIYLKNKHEIKELQEENKKLHETIKQYIENQERLIQVINHLEKENNQLKDDLQDAINKNENLKSELECVKEKMKEYKDMADKYMQSINNAKEKENKGGIFGSFIRWGVEKIASGVGTIAGAIMSIKDVEFKKAWNEGKNKGEELTISVVNNIVQTAGMAKGWVTGFFKSDFSKSFKSGQEIGEKVGKSIGETLSKVAGVAVGTSLGLLAADYSKSFSEGQEKGKEVGKAIGNFVGKTAGSIKGVYDGVREADYAGSYYKGKLNSKNATIKVVNKAAECVGNVAGVVEGLSEAEILK